MQFKHIFKSNFLFSFVFTLVAGLPIIIFSVSSGKYVFYCFWVLICLLTQNAVFGRKWVTFKLRLLIRKNADNMCMFLLAVSLLILVLSNSFSLVNMILAFIVIALAPGYSLLSLLEFRSMYSLLDKLAVSFSTSLALMSLIGMFSLYLPPDFRGVFIATTIVVLSAISCFKNLRQIKNLNLEIKLDNNFLLLILTLGIISFIYLNLYPSITYLIGLDIARHFSYAARYATTNSFPSSPYPLFHIFSSTFHAVAKPQPQAYQTVTVFLNLYIMLCFYVMACSILKERGESLPSLAMIFWFFFSSFAWLYFIRSWMPNSSGSYFTALGKVNDYSHGDIGWRRLFFFLPMEAGMSMVFTVIYLAMRKDINLKMGLIASILSATLILIHEYAALTLLIALLSLALVLHPNNLRKMIPLTSLGCVFSLSIYFILQDLGILAPLIAILTYMSLGTVPTVILLLRTKTKLKFLRNFNANIAKHITFPFIVILLVIYLSCVMVWLSGTLSFSIRMVDKLGYVTPIYYPVLLGTIGVLCILLFIVSSDFLSQRLKVIMLFTSILIVINLSIGYMQLRLISDYTYNSMSRISCEFVNALLSLRERRFIEILRPFIALIAVPFFSQKIFHKFFGKEREAFAAGIISFLLLSSVMSGFLGFEYWLNKTSSRVSPEEFEAIEILRYRSYETTEAVGLTLNSISHVKYTSIPIILSSLMAKAAFLSVFPEFPISMIRRTLNSVTIFYFSNARDKLDSFKDRYLYSLVRKIPCTFKNNYATIREITFGSPPVPQSDTALVIPVDINSFEPKPPFYNQETGLSNLKEPLYQAYNTLMFSGINYTTVILADPYIRRFNNLILPYDDFIFNDLIENTDGSLKTIIILNTNGYGPLLSLFAEKGEKIAVATQIKFNEATIILNNSLTLLKLYPKENIVCPSWYQQNFTKVSPFVMVKKEKPIMMIYINIYPLLQQDLLFGNSMIYKCIRKIINLDLFDSRATSIFYLPRGKLPRLLYRSFKANGTIEIQSSSVIFINLNGISLNVLNGRTRKSFMNVSELYILNGKIIINSDNIVHSGGIGFYAFVRIKNPQFHVVGSEAKIKIISNGVSHIVRAYHQEIILNLNGDISMLIRHPKLNIRGNVYFESLEATRVIPISKAGVTNVFFEGDIKFSISVCDVFSFTDYVDYYLLRNIGYQSPIVQVNELDYLTALFKYLSLSIFLALVIIVLYYIPKRKCGIV